MRGPPEEVIVPFPATLAHEPETTSVRSTLLISSMRALKEGGHHDRYLRAIAPEHMGTITSAVAGTWLPIDVGIAHYRACDALGLSTYEQLAIGGQVVRSLQQTFIGTVLKLAGAGAGVTPLIGMQKFATIYGRSFKGGGTRVVRLGPKDVRAEVTGLPLASISYFRVAYRGFIQAGCEFFSRKVFVAELGGDFSPTRMAYGVSWV
jgi:hypothetical protein